MKPNQTAIYYALGDSREGSPPARISRASSAAASKSFPVRPGRRLLGAHGLGFSGKPFQSVTQGSADRSAILRRGRGGRRRPPRRHCHFARIKQALGDRSAPSGLERLRRQPCLPVAAEGGLDRRLNASSPVKGSPAGAGAGINRAIR
jgi:hypothetical protein